MRKVGAYWLWLFVAAIFLQLQACGTITGTKRDESKMTPEQVVEANIKDSIAGGRITVKNLRLFNADMLNNARYSSVRGREIQQQLDRASAALDVAEVAIVANNIKDANAQLLIFDTAIGLVRALLVKKGVN